LEQQSINPCDWQPPASPVRIEGSAAATSSRPRSGTLDAFLRIGRRLNRKFGEGHATRHKRRSIMSLWVQLTIKDLANPNSESRPGLVNLERALWMEPYDAAGTGSVLHFGAQESVMVSESLEEIVDLLDAAEGQDEEFEMEEEEEE
jgi:hypothetical protein